MTRIIASGFVLALAACSGAAPSSSPLATIGADVVAFEKKAAPVVARACTDLHAVESNPLLQGGINIGIAAASGATGGLAGTAIGIVKGMGDAYCLNGPPLGDTTSPDQQAAWLLQKIVAPLAVPAR